MLDNETKRRIDTARDILVGKVPDPKSQVEQITIALIYKFMDDMDAEAEELGGERKFFSGEFEPYGWKKLMAPALGGFEVLTLYAEAIQKLNINPNIPQLFRDIFKNAYLPYRDPQTLKSFLKTIDEFNYNHSEKLGDAFEYLLSVLGSQGDAGQFRTPRHIIDFMVYLVDPKKNETILDPACGTAGFLISSYKHIVKRNSSNFNLEVQNEFYFGEIDGERYSGDKLTPDERTRLALNVKGYDISPDMVRLSLVNLYLHGFADPKISEYDTLTSDEKWNEHSDIILANPPFMSPKGGIRPHKRFSVESNRSEVLFVDYIAEHLTPNGRAAVIVPEGIIFQSGTAYKTLRKMLVENYLYAVVSLPAGVFNPYSGVKTSILLMDKTLAKKTDKILFAKVVNDGFDLGAQRLANDKSDLPTVANAIKDFGQSILNRTEFDADLYNNLVVATKEKIGENGDWGLSGERYRSVKIANNCIYELIPLDQICEITSSTRIFQEEYVKEGIPFYRTKEIVELSQNKQISLELFISRERYEEIKNRYDYPKRGEILLSAVGTIGISWVVADDREFYFKDGNLLWLKAMKSSHPYFIKNMLDYLFQNRRNEFIDGVAYNALTIVKLKKIQIPLPPLDIQKEIVAEIDGWQKIIDGARQVLENYKPQIEIDPSWEMVELGEVCDVRDGTHDSPKYKTVGYPLITSRNIKAGSIDFSDVNLISKEDWEKINQRSKVDPGDIIMPMIGTIGNPIIVNSDREFAIKNVALIKFKNPSLIDRYYLKYLLDSTFFKSYFVDNSSGSTQKFISLSFLRSLKIPLPDLQKQEKIASTIEEEQKLINACKELIKVFEAKIKAKIASIWGE